MLAGSGQSRVVNILRKQDIFVLLCKLRSFTNR